MKHLRNQLLLLGFVFWMLAGQADRAMAQDREVQRKWGFSAYLQTTQAEILIPIWLSQRFVLAPIIAANYTENTATLLGLGAALRVYTYMARLAPYYGIRTQAYIAMPNGGTSSTAYLIGLFYGGEFFLNQRFSLGIEPGVNLLIPPNSGPLSVSTSTMVTASVHF